MKPDNRNCAYVKDFEYHLQCHIERGKFPIHRTRSSVYLRGKYNWDYTVINFRLGYIKTLFLHLLKT